MYWNDKAVMLGGVAMLVLAACLIIFIGAQANATTKDPFDKDETAQFLTDVHDDETMYIVNGAVGVIIDGFIAFAAAGFIYILFRDRSGPLAVLAVIGLVANAVVSSVVDGSTILLTVIASDFVKGGPGHIAAGDPAILEVGRLVGMMTLAFTNIAFTSLGLGLLALGTLLAFAPEGAVNPPKWLGWVALIAGVSAILVWFVVVIPVAFVFFIVQFASSLILLIGLGAWLLRHRQLKPAAPAMA